MKDYKIKNILFDFGGVICNLNPERCLAEFKKIGCASNIFPNQYSQFSGIFQEIDRGTLSTAGFYEAVRQKSGMSQATDKQIHDAWVSLIEPIPAERFEALKQLKKFHNLYILSNSNEIHWEYIKNHCMYYQGEQVTDWFKQIFLSHVMHLEKPEPEIFQAVIDQAQINANETLFIDDSQLNLDGAKELGIHTMFSKNGDWVSKLLEQCPQNK